MPMQVSVLLTIVFCLSNAYMIYASTTAYSQPRADQVLFWSVNGVVLLSGIVLSFVP